MRLEQGTRCWIPDNRIGWLGVNVTKVEYNDNSKTYKIELANDNDSNECFVVETGNLAENNEKLPKLRNLDDTADDLTTLSHLNEPSVLNSVKLRYYKKIIYTFSGIVLIAVNPFDKLENLYTQEIIQKYQNVKKNDNPPHLFAISDEAYKCMEKDSISQSIIVSGESGAGKTVSAKYIMRFFASVHTEGTQINTVEIEKQILATNPIMESFGNAKTTRNDNSSRFGKYLRISFDEKSVICGAKIQTYLLERSRLVYQANNERNYHIFYQIVQGLPEHLKKELSLQSCGDYHYLNGGHTSTILGIDDSKEFRDTCDALKIVGIDERKQFELFKILASLLHIGNITIQNSRGEAVLANDEPNLLIACNLLGLDPKEFSKWIVKKKISTRSDNIASNLKYHEAIVARDSISKYIYSLLFDWLVSYINNHLCSLENEAKEKAFIGVLDIYGFEHFENNSFEQFCINYANEKLQQEFTHHVFKLQQEDYINEGIEWSFIKYTDNQSCIDLIEDRSGILSLLDEQCKLPAGSDKAWAEKMFHSLTKPPHNKVFKKARFGTEKFIVSHYALDVTYEVDGFLEKNRDTVSDAQNEVLRLSTNDFLKDVISSIEKSRESPEKSSTKERMRFGSRNKKPTLGYLFKNSLNDLMTTINSTNSHYIRCIKPNETKEPWEFDNLMVLSQLRACGVLETIQISLVGFPSKHTYEEFLQRFVVLLPAEDETKFKRGEIKSEAEMKKMSTKILRKLICDQSLFQTGKTKLFFRAGVLGQLEIAKTNRIKGAATILQKNIRRYLVRNTWLEAQASMINLQSIVRGSLIRTWLKNQRQSCLVIQSLLRGYQARKQVRSVILSTVMIQSQGRGMIARNQYRELIRIRDEARKKMEEKALEAKEAEILNEKHQRELIEMKEREMRELQEQVKIENEQKEKAYERQMEDERLKQKAQEKFELAQKSIRKKRLGEVDQKHANGDTTHAIKYEEPDSYHKYSNISKFTDTSFTDPLPITDYDEGADKIWGILENSLHPLKYSYNDLLGMMPSKSLAIITRFIVLRIKNISESIDTYEKQHPHISEVYLTERLEKNTRSDIMILKKMMRRVKYAKPDMAVKRLSIRSVNSISTEKIMFGQAKADPSHLDRNFRSGYADLLDYMKGSPIASTLVANLLLQDIRPPPEESEEPIPAGEVLFPSRLVVVILTDLWRIGMVNQSAVLLEKVMNIFKENIETLKDPEVLISNGAYLLNNVNEIRTCIAWSRYRAMSDFDSKIFLKAEERQDYLKMLLIMKRYCETVFGQMYNVWIKSILNELNKKTIDAVIQDETLYAIRQNPNVYFRHMFHKGPKYKMFDVLRVFNNVYLAMKSYCFDEVILTSVIHDLLTYTDVLCFNDIITRESYLTVDKGLLIKYNISLLIDWCNEHKIPDSPNKLMHLLTLCQILQLKKQGFADIDMIATTCDSVSRKQIEKIVRECDKNSTAENSKKLREKTKKLKEKDQTSSSEFVIPLEDDAFENAFLCMN
ncbi:hypothetical protein PMKS-000544 [Pichia membranifaciens]|uniref:Myosin motor domain-containing protein n=1 Tax=Pichia membranifaciens TaxID=4926 RepID=A0A1Q2YCF3_9ASCO|nr:hypothetical protein PMKS-000544 [Pichia membranifaciens]